VPISHQLASALTERIDSFSATTSAALRKDFLVLVGNVKRVKSYEDAEKLRGGIRAWRARLEDWLEQIRESIESRKRERPGVIPVDDAEVSGMIVSLRPAWAFSSELGSFPLRAYDPAMEQWWSKDQCFRKYEEDVGRWDARVRAKATAAWKAMDYVAQRATTLQGGGEAVRIKTKETETLSEGFRVQLVGFEGEREDFMPLLVEGLKFYAQRAKRVLPLLMSKQLPLVIRADFGSGGVGRTSKGAAASYHGTYIDVTPWAHPTTDLGGFAKIMAHEMGHHLYKVALSKEAQEAWDLFVRGGTMDLDLRDVAKVFARYGENPTVIDDALEKDDPILALQVQGLMNDPRYAGMDLFTLKDIEEYLASGKDPIVRVNRRPITGYAAKNPEEAFCEVIGLLVGYGPRTVLPEVLGFLRGVLPELRTEERKHV